MKMRILLNLGLLFLVSIFSTSVLYAQEWDFELSPRMDVRTSHLEGQITLNVDGAIEGRVNYRMEVQRVTAERFFLNGVNMDILKVEINGEPVSFTSEDHQIIIEPEVPFVRGDLFTLTVYYRVEPLFGVHIHNSGVMRTSTLPKSVRHWLPVFDHPSTIFSYEFEFIHPAGNEFIAGGSRSPSEIVSVQQESSVIQSELPLPVTSLGWITGQFPVQRSVTEVEDGSVTFYAETDYYGIDELIEEAVSLSERFQNLTGVRPFRELSIVLLDQPFMEVKQYNAGSVILYRNHGELIHQLRENLAAQWAGVYLTEESWMDADAVLYLRAMLFILAGLELPDITALATDARKRVVGSEQPYSSLKPQQFVRWLQFMDEEINSEMQQNVMIILPELFDFGSRALSWARFTDELYRLTGQPHFDRIDIPELESVSAVATTQETTEVPGYRIEVVWEEGADTAELRYQATGEMVSGSATISVTEFTFTENNTFEVEFSGSSGRVVISVSPAIENITFSSQRRRTLHLEVDKPYLFWITQLRESESADEKAEAARALGDQRGNPDLQLALGDLLQFEEDPVVVAELIRSISRLTMGASGTDERFIRYSSANQPIEIQLAAVEALGNFEGNERVIDRLRTVAIQTNNTPLREKAIHGLSRISDPGRFSEIARNLVSRDQLASHIPLIMSYLIEKEELQLVVDIAEYFLGESISDQLRADLIGILVKSDTSSSRWISRLPTLMQSRNPEIRIQAASALSRVEGAERERLRSRLLDQEFDARVRIVLSTS